jgi:hypothetical protein
MQNKKKGGFITKFDSNQMEPKKNSKSLAPIVDKKSSPRHIK